MGVIAERKRELQLTELIEKKGSETAFKQLLVHIILNSWKINLFKKKNKEPASLSINEIVIVYL